jgi:V/A-type H+-transporting ATPase subunit E
MNGIEKISNRLVADAEAEIAALNAQTQEKCDEIRAVYEQKARSEYESRMAEGVKAAETRLQRLGSAAEMEAKKSILAFKQEMVAKAFNDAAEKLANLPREQYVQFLAAQAAAAAATGAEELIFNERDKAAVGADVAAAANALLAKKGLPGKLTVSADTRPISGGVIVRQGNIEVNCAVETLVQLRRSELASQVAEILFS